MKYRGAKNRWKVYLAIAAVVIVSIAVYFTTMLTSQLKEQERERIQIWAQAINEQLAGEDDQNLTFVQSIVVGNKNIPAILADEFGEVVQAGVVNYPENRLNDAVFLKNEVERLKRKGNEIVVSDGFNTQYVYYKNSRLLTWLSYFPYFMFALVGLFLLAGYLAFSSARKAEQNQVWVGMAKETAHQLGTPISSIVAWIEYLKEQTQSDPETGKILTEFKKDVGRLELIAERFSKIGSAPELHETDLNVTVKHMMEYIKRRASRRIDFTFSSEINPAMAKINPLLFEWVIENIMKNALDAMDEGKGSIRVEISQGAKFTKIDISDTGKGMPRSRMSQIFEPGFTTKKRGWGLGLSLSKRIVESYHLGKIFVKNTAINEGTTFRILLPI